jgi:hypothetical protein
MPSYGRGGVGNIQAVAQQSERIAADVESNESIEESITASHISDIIQRERHQYVYAGRGGAGNFYNADEMKETQPSDGIRGAKPTKASSSMSTNVAGRGGAGNYQFAAIGNEQQIVTERMKEQQTREKLKQDIVKDVSEQLAMPQKAKLPRSQMHKR